MRFAAGLLWYKSDDTMTILLGYKSSICCQFAASICHRLHEEIIDCLFFLQTQNSKFLVSQEFIFYGPRIDTLHRKYVDLFFLIFPSFSDLFVLYPLKKIFYKDISSVLE